MPFLLMHVMPFFAFFTGVRRVDIVVCVALYYLRMFFITAGFHRYFAHRSFQLGRVMQFIMAFGGTMAAQKGPLWWSAYHRHHHAYSDQEQDIHSPVKGWWWSHVGWFMCKKYAETPLEHIKDFAKYPELRFLDKHFLLPPTMLAIACFLMGGSSMLITGFFLSTVLGYHGTFAINSLAHLVGRRRYVTNDSSRNNWFLALITCGEGWHNNHHYFPASSKQGFFWWEFDLTYYVLKFLSWFGLVKNLQVPPEALLQQNRIKDGCFDIGMFKTQLTKALNKLIRGRVITLPNIQNDLRAYVEMKNELSKKMVAEAKEVVEEVTRLYRGTVQE